MVYGFTVRLITFFCVKIPLHCVCLTETIAIVTILQTESGVTSIEAITGFLHTKSSVQEER